MKRRILITILFMLLATGILLWLDMRPMNQRPSQDRKMRNVGAIDREFQTRATNSRVTREKRIKNISCSVSDEQAIAATEEFMNKIGLGFQGTPNVRDTSLSNVDYPGIRDLKDVSYGQIRFYVGCESGVVENYDDFGKFEDNFPYSAKKVPSNSGKTIESLAQQIGIPSDMHFETVEHDWRKGVWVGKFVRIRDGYKYDLDNISIGISGKTGKIALYRKIYFGQSCPTEIKIQKDEVIRIASTEFSKFLFEELRSKSDELYDRKVQLLIVQPERSENALSVGVAEIANPPLKEKPSRLAWVIRYNFTGGSKYQKASNSDPVMSPEERQRFEAYISEREYLLRKYGNPVHSFEMRIDAGNGDILYVSHKNPEYYLKKKNRRCK
jgi:hypothetical protein